MNMSNKTTIDFSKWCTQVEYSRKTGIKLTTVSQWVKRAKAGTSVKIDYLDIPELSITLVRKI